MTSSRRSSPEHGVTIGVIATPADAAQDVCDRLVAAGVTGILNFAPVVLHVPDGVDVRKVDLSVELQILSFHEQRKSPARRERRRRPLPAAAPPAARHRDAGRTHHRALARVRRGERPRCRARHRTAPTAAARAARARRRRPAQGAARAGRGRARRRGGVLSTCNRVEVYAKTTDLPRRRRRGHRPARPGQRRRRWRSCSRTSTPLHEARAVQHLFSVACGLDSMLVGESQILGQVRAAFRLADEEGTDGRVLGELFRHAVRVGKRARTETGIDRGRPLAGRGRARARRRRDRRRSTGRRALVVGAGSTGALAASQLRRAGVGERRRRQPLRRAGAARWPDSRRAASASTSWRAALAERRHRRRLDRRRRPGHHRGRPPRPLRPAAAAGRCSCSTCAAARRRPRRRDAARREPWPTSTRCGSCSTASPPAPTSPRPAAIVDDEVSAFLGWQRASRVAPTVVALRAKAETMVARRARPARRPAAGPRRPAVRARSSRPSSGVVDKLLHAPTVRVKQLAEAPGGDCLRRGAARAVRPRPVGRARPCSAPG